MFPEPQRQAASTSEAALGCVECLQDHLRHLALDLQLLQLDRGVLSGRVLAVSLPPLRLFELRVDRRLHSLGPKPRGVLTVSLDLDPLPGEAAMRAHGQPLCGDTLFGIDPGREAHLILPAQATLGTVLLPLEVLRHWAEELRWPGFDGELETSTNVLHLDRTRSIGLRRQLRQVFALARRTPRGLQQPGTQRLILEDLIPLLLEALFSASSPSRGTLPRPPARIDLVKEVQQWMHANPSTPITLAELCRQAHASRRTLIQGFQDHLGIPPMAYLKLIRLHGVRRRLLQERSKNIQIGPIAAEWGFYNAGHFAADYRHLFGERPRETLRRAS